MTPAQQTALESVAGRALNGAELAAIETLLPARNDVAIAAVLSAGQPPVKRSIRVEDVFSVVFETGDYLTLKSAQQQGNPLAVMVFSVLADAKTIGPGLVNLQAGATVGLFDQLQAAGLLSAASREGFDAISSGAAPAINFNLVSDALNVAEGRMVL